MREYGAGDFAVIVEKKDGSVEKHKFATRESRTRFIDHNRKDPSIKTMTKEPL